MIDITLIQPEHNKEMADIIRRSLEDFDIDLNGTVYVDPYLDDMYSHFTVQSKAYFIATDGQNVLGGSGIAPLDDTNIEVCELQRMFVSKAARKQGIGMMLMKTCITEARNRGFKQCYLETFADMQDAIRLYERSGFTYLEAAMGNTGHFACKTWMIQDL